MMVHYALDAAEKLSKEGIEAEVIDALPIVRPETRLTLR